MPSDTANFCTQP